VREAALGVEGEEAVALRRQVRANRLPSVFTVSGVVPVVP
jgi:hypothetical protein